jgi:hypothetical protein
MKTNETARRIVKIGNILLCAAIIGLAGMDFGLGRSFASKFGQMTPSQLCAPQVPSVSICDVMAAAR